MARETAGKAVDYRIYFEIAAGVTVLAVLYYISRENYLLFHGIAEVFSSVVAFMIFILAWHTRRLMDNDYLLFLGIAYLFIGVMDLLHMLAYSGMGVFAGYGTNLPTQLWITTRYIEAFSLLAAPIFLSRVLKEKLDIAVNALVVSLVLLSIFYWDIFPSCYVEGAGLTPFKKVSEYVISFILLLAIGVLWRNRKEFDERVFRLIVASIAVTIASELSFTLYVDPYGFFNMLGHFLKILSFYLIYRAIVETGLEKPYDILFRDLKQREGELEIREKRERAILDSTLDSITLIDADGTVLAVNETAARNLGKDVKELMGSDILEFFPPEVAKRRRAIIEKSFHEGRTVRFEDDREGKYFDNAVYPIFNEQDEVDMLAVFAKDITQRKLAEEALQESEDKFRSIVEQSTDGIVLTGSDGLITEWNRAQEKITGVKKEEALGRFLWDVQYELLPRRRMIPEEYELLKAPVLKSLEASHNASWLGESREQEIEMRNGRFRILQTVTFPLHTEKGFMLGSISRDISDHVRAEKELRRYSYDLEERIKELNCLYELARIVEEPGITMEDILERTVEILPPAWRYPEITCARITARGATYRSAGFEETGWRQSSDIMAYGEKTGSIEVFYREERPPSDEGPFFKEERELLEAVAERLGRVIERLEMREALRESEEKYRLIVDNAQEGIWTIDADANTSFVNQRMADILGYTVDEMMGRHLFEFMDERGRELAEKNLERRRRGVREQHDFEFVRKDGSRIYASLETSPLLDEEGNYAGAVAMVADITERKLAEDALAWELEASQVIADLSSALLVPGPIDEVTYLILESAKRLTGSRYGFVGYIDVSTGYLVSPTLSRDIWEECEVEGKDTVFRKFSGLWGWVLNNRKPLLSNSPGEDSRSTGVPKGHIPIERFLSVPAVMGDTLLGQIALANPSREYDERDLNLVSRMADLYAVALLRMWSEEELEKYREHLEELVSERTEDLERINQRLQREIAERQRKEEQLRIQARELRALSMRLQSIREEERRRIAREVHDKLGQELTGLKINLSLLGKKVAGEKGIGGRIKTMSDLIDSTIHTVREISSELRPGLLDDLGLVAALEWQLQRFEEMTGIKGSFDADIDEDRLDKDVNIALFRIAQEALTNVARHAEATGVSVLISSEEGHLLLEIADNGIGASDESVSGAGAMGILGMRERAHVFGGTVDIVRREGKGTVVKVRIPFGWSKAENGFTEGALN